MKFNKTIISLALISLFIFPIFIHAQATRLTYECNPPGDCEFSDVIAAIQNLVSWGVTFALAFSVVVLVFAGYKYMISGDNPGERKEANKMLWKVVVGIVLVLAAWLIVNLITDVLLGKKLDNFGI